MSPVNLAEFMSTASPEAQARLREQIGETQDTLATVQPLVTVCLGKLKSGQPCQSRDVYIHGFCKRHAPSAPTTTALAIVEPKPHLLLDDADPNVIVAKQEIAEAWKTCQAAEKYGLEFGRVCYEWQQKFVTKGGVGNKGKGIQSIWNELNIPLTTAYRWITAYMESQGIVRLHIEKRRNRVDPPDSFEVLRKLAIKMLNDGLKNAKDTSDAPAAYLEAAKTWAYCRIKESLPDAPAPILDGEFVDAPQPAEPETPVSVEPVNNWKPEAIDDCMPVYTRASETPDMCAVCIEHPHKMTERPFDYSMHPELQTQTASRSHGMGLERLRKLASELNVACAIKYDDGFKITCTYSFASEAEAKNWLHTQPK